MTRYSRVAPADGALHHLDVLADAVLLVHDEVAGAQLQRVDDVAAPATASGACPWCCGGCPTRSASVSRPSRRSVREKPCSTRRRRHEHHGRLRGVVDATASSRAGDVRAGEHLDHALGRAVALGGGDDAPARRDERRAGRRAPSRSRRGSLGTSRDADHDDVGVRELGVGRRGSEIDHHGRPVARACSRTRASGQYDEALSRRVEAERSIGSVVAGRRRSPTRRRGTPRSSPPGRGSGCGSSRGRRATTCVPSGSRSSSGCISSTSAGASDSMPSTAMPSEIFSQHVGDAGEPVGQRGGPGADGVGEQDLAAGRRPQAVLGDLERALVRDREPADLLDGVAPELDAQRVVLGRREHVEDAAPDGELAAALDHVGAGVRRGGERLDGLLQAGVVPRPQPRPGRGRRARRRRAA